MSFSERDKLVALAIVHIFETSKPFGDYAAVAVLNDGAGVSYGINQFTHRSGSLEAVLNRFQDKCRAAGTQVLLQGYERKLHDRSTLNIHVLSSDERFKNGLRYAADRSEMREAQREIAFEKYLKPALDACAGSDFELPLSLAVIYDSINHGSYEKIRDRVVVQRPGNGSMKEVEFEKEWITRYVKKRDAWLESIPRLAPTDYRTDFFIAQIARGNWDLNLPLNVHGFRLTESIFEGVNPFAGITDEEISNQVEDLTAVEPQRKPPIDPPVELTDNSEKGEHTADKTSAEAPPTQQAENILNLGGGQAVPANFIPEEKTADAPPPTGFMAKLKAQGAALLATIGGAAGLKEWFGIQLSAETVELLKVLLPTVLGLGFIGFVVWYVSEKVVGFKTLKMQAEINADPNKHNLRIRPQ